MAGKDDSDRSAYRKGPSEYEKKAGAGPDFQPEFVSNHTHACTRIHTHTTSIVNVWDPLAIGMAS